ncbi:hypothetical protein HDU79_010403 [Rhizoclosmatium sp. JEL0117]|nr:hypothetical protein HDU79_010403 [Rhizoclosmatium sp. JEL0117]
MGAAFDASAGIVTLIISVMGLLGTNFTSWHALNPNTDNVPLDYYCYPGATYNDWDCSYYLAQDITELADGTPCVA